MSDVYAEYRAKYDALCAERDAKLAEVAPLVEELTKANAEVASAQEKANAIAVQISDVKGGQYWLDLKRHIGALAKLLGGK